MRRRWHRWVKRDRIVSNLLLFQDLIVLFLCIGLFGAMVLQLGDMFHALLHIHSTQEVTSDTLVLLILLELFRLLVIYFQEHRISVPVAVEVAIVSILREIIVRGLLEIPSDKILAICAFLSALGVLLLVRPWMPRRTDTIRSTENDLLAEENQK